MLRGVYCRRCRTDWLTWWYSVCKDPDATPSGDADARWQQAQRPARTRTPRP